MQTIRPVSAPVIFVDTETSGLDENLHSILEVAAIAYDLDKHKILGTYQAFVHQANIVVSPTAMAVNKIDLSTLGRVGLDPTIVSEQLSSFIRLHGAGELVEPVGHNVDFDLRFLKAFYKKCGKRYPFAYRTMDTCSVARFLMRSGILAPGSCKLVDLAQTLGVPVDLAKIHGALYDAELTMQVFLKMSALVKNNTIDAASYT